jgi:hypothetical protein
MSPYDRIASSAKAIPSRASKACHDTVTIGTVHDAECRWIMGNQRAPYFCVSWPTGEFAQMGIEGQVKLGYAVQAMVAG